MLSYQGVACVSAGTPGFGTRPCTARTGGWACMRFGPKGKVLHVAGREEMHPGHRTHIGARDVRSIGQCMCAGAGQCQSACVPRLCVHNFRAGLIACIRPCCIRMQGHAAHAWGILPYPNHLYVCLVTSPGPCGLCFQHHLMAHRVPPGPVRGCCRGILHGPCPGARCAWNAAYESRWMY